VVVHFYFQFFLFLIYCNFFGNKSMDNFLFIFQTVLAQAVGPWRWLGSHCAAYTTGLCKVLSNSLLFSNRDVYSSVTYFPLLANISRPGQGHTTSKVLSFCQLASSCTLASMTSLESKHPGLPVRIHPKARFLLLAFKQGLLRKTGPCFPPSLGLSRELGT